MSDDVYQKRNRFNFASIVNEKFAFLHTFGFSKIEQSPTIVRYARGDIGINIYHGRQSYELGLEISNGRTQYPIGLLIRIANPELGVQYRNFVATTPQGISEGLTRLAELVEQYGIRAIQGDQEFFAVLEYQRKEWAEQYALDILVEQLRPKAEAAFRQGNYPQAVELYERIRPGLSTTELKKLEFAKVRAGIQ